MILTKNKTETDSAVATVNESLASLEYRLERLKVNKEAINNRHRDISSAIEDYKAEIQQFNDMDDTLSALRSQYISLMKRGNGAVVMTKPIDDGFGTIQSSLDQRRSERESELEKIRSDIAASNNYPSRFKQLKGLIAERKAQIKRMAKAYGWSANDDRINLQSEHKEVYAKFRLMDPTALSTERQELEAQLRAYTTYRDELIAKWIVENEVERFATKEIRFGIHRFGSVKSTILYRTLNHIDDRGYECVRIDGASKSVTVLGEGHDIGQLVTRIAKEKLNRRRVFNINVGFVSDHVAVSAEFVGGALKFTTALHPNNRPELTVI